LFDRKYVTRIWGWAIVLAATAFLSGCLETTAPGAERPSFLVDLAAVPLDAHRRAANLLEDLRGGPLGEDAFGPGWQDAVLWPHVVAMRRPDLDGIAYYEFPLVARDAATDAARPWVRLQDASAEAWRGAIVVSADEHDEPIVAWSTAGPPATAELVAFATDSGTSIDVVWRLDVGAFVGEDRDGVLRAALGPNLGERAADVVPLARVSGMQLDWLSLPDEELPIASTISVPLRDGEPVDAEGLDDASAAGIEHRVDREGPTAFAPVLDDWPDWPSLKSGYASSYAVFLEADRRDAAAAWEVERAVAASGEGLVAGRTYRIPSLFEDATIEVSGPGADLVVVAPAPDGAAFELTVASDAPQRDLTVTVAHPALGRSETLLFFTVPLEVARAGVVSAAAGAGVAPTAVTAWSDWRFEDAAGLHDAQRLYEQFPWDGCPTGCGATAWAMLFGWADYLAGQRVEPWTPRFGIYRIDGAKSGGADAIAPKRMETGPRRITVEIRGYIDTFCLFGNAPTYPTQMGDAAAYLSGRTYARIATSYNGLGYRSDSMRNRVIIELRDRDRAAVVGLGVLQHYAVAVRYATRQRWLKDFSGQPVYPLTERRFYVNQGWGGYRNGYVAAKTWFAGSIRP
jgi:hypothetical protein